MMATKQLNYTTDIEGADNTISQATAIWLFVVEQGCFDATIYSLTELYTSYLDSISNYYIHGIVLDCTTNEHSYFGYCTKDYNKTILEKLCKKVESLKLDFEEVLHE